MLRSPIDRQGRRGFLFLQGPHGPFFARLGQALSRHGHGVDRVNFCGGDRHDWPGPALDYRGRPSRWPDRLARLLAERPITDMVLYGDCRPLHVAAHRVARAAGVAIWVFEEGYLRPDWMTLERDGVNGHSSLPTDPLAIRDAARTLPPLPVNPPVPSSLRRRLRQSGLHVLHSNLQRWRFPFYRTHRPLPGTLEAAGWAWKLLRRRAARARTQAALADLDGRPYHLLPLQLDSDYQLRLHSPFGSMREAADRVIESFATQAAPDALLLVKRHPLDNGLIDWRRRVLAAARRFDAAGRVLFLEGGDIARLVACADGVVTVNSTTGTLALGQGVAVKVLGRAVYDIAGITHPGPLASFWTQPAAPDPALWDALCRVLHARCLVHGGLSSEAGLDRLVSGSIERLLGSEMAVPGRA